MSFFWFAGDGDEQQVASGFGFEKWARLEAYLVRSTESIQRAAQVKSRGLGVI